MQFTLRVTRRAPHGASRRMVKAMSAWLVKSGRAPSLYSRDARIYGHMTADMHKLRTPQYFPRPQPSPVTRYLHQPEPLGN